MKLFICGHARHGKDHAAEFLRKPLNISFESSSYFAIKHFLYERLKDEFGFTSADECFNRRHEDGMRKRLFDEICALNVDDPTFLSDAIFSEHDCYVGIRNYTELDCCKKRWPEVFVIWIDASKRVPPESSDSCTVAKEQADIIIENNESVAIFNDKLSRFCTFLDKLAQVKNG